MNADPVLEFVDRNAWAEWLAKYYSESTGVWVRLAKKECPRKLMAHADGLEEALCHGWIDANKKGESESTWLQRFTPRTPKSIWSKINCAKALQLIESGAMKPAGVMEVLRAKADGRWDAAYDSPRTAAMPEDFQAALEASSRAQAFFVTLNAANRYAILFRLQTTKTTTTRQKKIGSFIEMLERREKFHP